MKIVSGTQECKGTPYYKWAYGKFILVGYIKEDKDENKNRV